ncbi:MAG: hypothetical protein ISP01_07135 [Methanobrevibacter arboriphilus]|uniref:Uncharacterized protein n=1 Tax=Methanobrevibacter arboriphilus TaxID=39441 RepID=A0A843AEN6_METAZ|nr:hypothetical protein [Methanobrevibacter arboriphilus]MBF4469164.1 hypothetical protein [Methanobrevibacter arboriphilus]
MKRTVKLTGKERKEIAKDVLREMRSIEVSKNDAESIGTYRANKIAAFLNDIINTGNYELKNIEIREEI